MSDKIQDSMDTFHEECTDLIYHSCTVPEVDIKHNDPNWPLQFYREYAGKNVPVLIRNGCKKFKATQKWNSQYFMEKIGEKSVTVAITPNGYADGLTFWQNSSKKEEIFALPEEREMKMKEFLGHINDPKYETWDNFICYIQRQNSNLTEDFKELFGDIQTDVPWASEAFGRKPDAVNFWMGDQRAITSMHKDFYENIYCVIDGYKDFLLLPPSNLPHITYKKYKVGKYKDVTPESYSIDICKNDENEIETVPWIANDPLKTNPELYPNFSKANLYSVRVHKGDCLYLPSKWFHHVQQSHGCIAVNYWYDMDFDIKFCFYKLLENLCINDKNKSV